MHELVTIFDLISLSTKGNLRGMLYTAMENFSHKMAHPTKGNGRTTNNTMRMRSINTSMAESTKEVINTGNNRAKEK